MSRQVRILTKDFPGAEERELERQLAELTAERGQMCDAICIEFGLCHLCQ
jgi:hypothetical protein